MPIETPSNPSRRDFLHKTVAGASVLALGSDIIAKTSPWQETGIPTRPLGNTGENISIIAVGGWHIRSIKEDQEAIRVMHQAINEGVTFFDNAWDYHDGASEELMGKALSQDGLRDKVFLMTKNCERDYEGSLKNLEDSLRRLRTDRIDLWQFHEMVYDNDPDWVFEKGGIKAAMEAQKAGKVKYIGFTGHKDPLIHLKMLNKPFDWDACLMPINVCDYHYRSFENQVIPVCLEKNVGALGMKALGNGSPGILPTNTGISAQKLRQYALSQPITSLVCGIGSKKDLEQDVAIARNFKPLSLEEQDDLRNKVREVAGDGRFELFKSTKAFDGPHHRKQHGFSL